MKYRFVTSFFFITLLMILITPVCRVTNPDFEKKQGIRIISLSPSITSQIIDLGAEDNIVGVTPYHPPLKKKIPLVGNYISPSIEKIITLKPDIIFMSDEDGEIQTNSFFKKFGLRFHRFGRNPDFKTICDNYYLLGKMIGKSESAEQKIINYKNRLKNVKRNSSKLKTVFLVSVKPLITVSKFSHISDIITEAGGINVFNNLHNPYPILTLESLIVKNPDVVIVMNRDDDKYLYKILKKFTGSEFVNRKNIFVAGDENIPYYTPKDYILSVEKISEILSRVNK